MSRGLRPIPVILFAAALAAVTTAGIAAALASGRDVPDELPPGAVGFLALAVLAPAGVGLFVALRRPGNRVAWILLAGPLSVGVVFAGNSLARLWLSEDPGSSDGAWAQLVASLWPVIFAWPVALAFVFPDGRLPSRRWRWPWFIAVGSFGGALLLLTQADPIEGDYGDVPNPLPATIDQGVGEALFWICWAGILVSLASATLALRARYKAGGPQERRQVLWLAYGAILLPLWLGGGSLISLVFGSFNEVIDGVGLLVIQVWPAVAVAIAVTRHGLYEIDRVLNRTLVYAVLTALLAGTYALVALGVGTVVGGSSLTASIATLSAALLFLPLRRRVQAVVDRRFARRRVEATRLLRDYLEQVREGHAEPEDIGEAVALALGDPGAEIVFRLPESDAYADETGRLLDGLPDDGRARAVIGRDDRELGVLLHSAHPAPEPDLLRAVQDEAVVPVELARLRVELRLQLAEVESSRARIAQAGYAERRRIERDLHDGAQQRLVTLGIVLRRLQRSLPDEARVLVPALDAAVDEVAGAITDLRTIAAGVRPPRLDEGLAAALADLARGAAVPVEVAATPRRAPPEVEAAAYFVACEALTNAVKHADASRVVVETARENGMLRMTVSDDGVGGAAASTGTGLSGMHDRVAAHGGTLAIDSPPGAGTRIQVVLPCGS